MMGGERESIAEAEGEEDGSFIMEMTLLRIFSQSVPDSK